MQSHTAQQGRGASARAAINGSDGGENDAGELAPESRVNLRRSTRERFDGRGGLYTAAVAGVEFR